LAEAESNAAAAKEMAKADFFNALPSSMRGGKSYDEAKDGLGRPMIVIRSEADLARLPDSFFTELGMDPGTLRANIRECLAGDSGYMMASEEAVRFFVVGKDSAIAANGG
jgi:hypothetical protein